jgi:chemotaxis protein methyltransferase CheR
VLWHAEISEQKFKLFQQFFAGAIGLNLPVSKRALLTGRLSKRLSALELERFGDYFKLITRPDMEAERQLAIDLITTNETYFFREPKHFERLRQMADQWAGARPLMVWSAACSTGEEPYTIAMILDDVLGHDGYRLQASDISTRALAAARRGLYPIERALQHLPPHYLKRYCLRGNGQYHGQLLVMESLRRRVEFRQVNLMAPPPRMGTFDIVFLRNVMIYFDEKTKQHVLTNVCRYLQPGGWLFVGHAETLIGNRLPLEVVCSGVYRKLAT